MSNQDRLLSDLDLREAARRAIIDNMGLISYEASLDALVDLINTQKRIYAESVIGEDEEHSEYCNREQPKLGWCVCKEGTRNGLRAEQRGKIK